MKDGLTLTVKTTHERMLYRVRYFHTPLDDTARTYWSDARTVASLANRFVRDDEIEVMIEGDDGGVWTPEQFKTVAA